MVDEFNEYLFDFTSKIPVEEIEKMNESKQVKEVSSPYTKVDDKNDKTKMIILSIIIIVVLIIVGYLIVSEIKGNDFKDNGTTYTIRR